MKNIRSRNEKSLSEKESNKKKNYQRKKELSKKNKKFKKITIRKKNSTAVFNSRWDVANWKINELENRSEEIA